jgi:hypothetical protein
MALTHILTDGSETGLTAANKINASFTQVDINTNDITLNTANVSTNATNIATNTANILALDGRVTTNETDITTLENQVIAPAIGFLILAPQAEQTLVANTFTKVAWNEPDINVFLNNGGTDIEYDNINQRILVKTAGTYRILGTANFTATSNDWVDFNLFIDNINIGLNIHNQALGDTHPIPISFNLSIPFTGLDNEVEIYARSTGTDITMTNINFTIEKLPY